MVTTKILRLALAYVKSDMPTENGVMGPQMQSAATVQTLLPCNLIPTQKHEGQVDQLVTGKMLAL